MVYQRMFEMSRIRKYKGKWFYTKPSSSDTPVPRARNEHLPPHIELIKNNQTILKVNIPMHIPTNVGDIVTKPDITNKIKRDLIEWFNKSEYDETFDRQITSYELSIRFWNRDNLKYKIDFTIDDDLNVIINHFPTIRSNK